MLMGMSYLDLSDPSDGTDFDRYVDVSPASPSHCYFALSDGECEVGVKLTREQARNVAEMLGDWYRGEGGPL